MFPFTAYLCVLGSCFQLGLFVGLAPPVVFNCLSYRSCFDQCIVCSSCSCRFSSLCFVAQLVRSLLWRSPRSSPSSCWKTCPPKYTVPFMINCCVFVRVNCANAQNRLSAVTRVSRRMSGVGSLAANLSSVLLIACNLPYLVLREVGLSPRSPC